jgi:hypothetical protein
MMMRMVSTERVTVATPRTVTLLDVVQTHSEYTISEEEVVATVAT